MHTKPMPESAGTFRKPEQQKYICRRCLKTTAACRMWESSCGGYEDYKYECQDKACGYEWWVDGIDS